MPNDWNADSNASPEQADGAADTGESTDGTLADGAPADEPTISDPASISESAAAGPAGGGPGAHRPPAQDDGKPDVFQTGGGRRSRPADDKPEIFNTGAEEDWAADDFDDLGGYGGSGAGMSDIPGWAIWIGILIFANILSCAFDWGFIIY